MKRLSMLFLAASLYAAQDSTVSIIGVGDIMLGTSYPSSSYLPPNDGADLLAPVASILSDASVSFGNLEGSLFSGVGSVKTCADPANCYAFKSPEHYVDYLVGAGFDAVAIANNHVGDFGEAGRASTLKVLGDHGIAYAGLLTAPYSVFKKDGVTYGFCAFAPNSGTTSINDIEAATAIVRHLDSVSDIVVVYFHGGAEGSGRQHITRSDELFLGENRGNPYVFARAVVDAGADVVFGSGPHVTRAIDLYKGRFIAYSLGNFATYGRFNLKGSGGVAPIIKVTTDKHGVFLGAHITSTKQVGEGGPVVDPDGRALAEIMALTAKDIQEAQIVIRKDGGVSRR